MWNDGLERLEDAREALGALSFLCGSSDDIDHVKRGLDRLMTFIDGELERAQSELKTDIEALEAFKAKKEEEERMAREEAISVLAREGKDELSKKVKAAMNKVAEDSYRTHHAKMLRDPAYVEAWHKSQREESKKTRVLRLKWKQRKAEIEKEVWEEYAAERQAARDKEAAEAAAKIAAE